MKTIDKVILPTIEELKDKGFIKFHYGFPNEFKQAATSCNWEEVDRLIFKYLQEGGYLHQIISKYQEFYFTEHIIALRHAESDEEGIWHDDGSREIAFTWSLNDDPELCGGELLFKSKHLEDLTAISPPPMETLIIFLTGKSGFEHKVNKVTKGTRKTIAGWCSIEKPSWIET